MDSTYTIGLLLVGLSAFLLASHWQQWRDAQGEQDSENRWRDHIAKIVRRRVVASSLVGAVGATLMAFETVPQTPLSITSYLLALVLMTSWIMWLACLDVLSNRRYQEEQQLDRIASELRRTSAVKGEDEPTNG